MRRILFAASCILTTGPAHADALDAATSMKVIQEGDVISSFIGDGSSQRQNIQSAYITWADQLYFCTFYTQKLRSTTEAVVASECYKSSE